MTLRRPKMRSKTAVAMALLLIAVVATSMSVAPSSTVLAQSSGICERTQEVRDAVLAKLSDVSDCANVTDSHLAGLAGDLTLSNESISALKAGDFLGLTGLEHLYLNNNSLSDLPDGIFEGLESLDTLWLNFNPGSPFSLTMTLEKEGSNSVVVNIAEGVPFDMPVTLSAEGGTLSSTTVTVEGGSLKSGAVSVSPSDQSRVQTADVQVTVSVESSDFSATDYSNYFGLTWEEADDLELALAPPSGICGRTQEVQDAILARLSGVSDCADVTDTHLASITYLDVGSKDVDSLKEGDFAGLSALRELWLTDNDLTTLPEMLFDGLSSLEELFLQRNEITALPEDVFDGLSSLTRLHIEQNDIDTLPEDIFDGLAKLQKLYMQSNGLTGLPENVFDGLSSLEEVGMSHNKLSTLPEDLFDGLSNLRELNAESNLITSLPEDVFDGLGKLESLYLEQQNFFNPDATLVLTEHLFDGLSSLTTLSLKNANLQSLPEDIFDGLSELVTLNLEENAFSALPEDLFDGLGSLTLLNLYNNRIGSLPEDVFDGLGELQTLNLKYNQISSLPDELFSGLSNLEVLYLGDNPGTSFVFTAELEQRGDNGVVVQVAEGAPFNMSVTLNFKAGALSTNLAVPISGGDLTSGVVNSPVSDDDGVTVTVVAAVFLKGSHEGIQTGLGESLALSSPTSTSEGESENTPATGAPTISGTAQVGQTLTASTSDIADVDGLTNVSYSYHWLTDDTDIDGATSSIYAVQASDNGKVIKVRVTFTDDAGNEESLTSIGTSAVVMGGL